MGKTQNVVLNRTRKTENFGNKASMLGVEGKDQVELLNGIYKGQVVFQWYEDSVHKTEGIAVKYIDKNIISLELPETEWYNMRDLLPYELFTHQYELDKRGGIIRTPRKSNLVTVKMPKCLDKLEVSTDCSWMAYIQRLFVWDTTELTFNKDRLPHGLEMVAVLSTKGAKPKVIKLK